MKRMFSRTVVGALLLSGIGCARITSQVVEKPRIDQELKGNRGYLMGSPPQAGPRKEKRQMIQTDIELPTASELNPWKVSKVAQASPVSQAQAVPASASMAHVMPMEPPGPEPLEAMEAPFEQKAQPRPARMEPEPAATIYTVKKGDTLEKIAAKVYGDASQWRRIYKANQDKLKSPNRIYAGQKLIIPPAKKESGEPTRRARAHEEFK